MLWYVSKIVNVVFCYLLVTQVVEPSHGSSAFSFLRSSVVNEERMRPVGGFLSWVWCFEFPSRGIWLVEACATASFFSKGSLSEQVDEENSNQSQILMAVETWWSRV